MPQALRLVPLVLIMAAAIILIASGSS